MVRPLSYIAKSIDLSKFFSKNQRISQVKAKFKCSNNLWYPF